MPSTTQDLERKIAWSIRAGTAFPSPAHAGDLFYRTDLNEYYIYNGVAWIPWRTRGYTIVVAASNSLDPTLADSAYRCDGTADQVEINAAITALGATGGAVILLDGTYEITAAVTLASNVSLMGQGAGTVLRVPNGHDANLNVIYGNGIDHVLVANLKVDGNRANQAAGTMHGIHFVTVTYSKVVDCWVEDMYGGDAILLETASDHNIVSRNTCQNSVYGIELLTNTSYNIIDGNTCRGNDDGIEFIEVGKCNTIIGNTCQGNTYYGIYLYDASYNTVTGNTCEGNAANDGIYLYICSYNVIIGNICQGNGQFGIGMDNTCNHNTIEGNMVEGNSQDANNTYDGILVDTFSDYNNIQGNTVRQGVGANKQRYGINIAAATSDGNLMANNDLYQAGATANFSDIGTGTVVRDNRGWVTENNVLSPAFAIDAVAVVTVTIPHGLDVTPAPEDCQLTVVEDTDVDDWQEGFVKVESVGAVNVVAKVNVTALSATGGATAKLALHVDLAGG